MMKKFSILAFIIVALSAFCLELANATDTSTPDSPTNDTDKSWVLSFIENKISSPNRQIRISHIQGALSSSAEIGSITVADRNGVWLKITNAKMDWNRLALLRGQVSINGLSAERIDILRKPLPEPKTPSPEASTFAIPELPVAVNIKSIETGTVSFAEPLFGLPSKVSLNGTLSLADGNLIAKLVMQRLDAAGQFNVLADISNSKNLAKIDIGISEQENGIVSNLLKIENRPAVELSVKGDGSLDNFHLALVMQAGQEPVLNGALQLQGSSNGKVITGNLSGPISLLMPDEYHGFFGSNTTLEFNAMLNKGGGFHLERFTLNGEGVRVEANAEILADGFLRRLKANAVIASQSGKSLILPVAGGQTRADRIALNVDYGKTGANNWNGQFVVNNFTNENFSAHDITFEMGGDSENLDDPQKRHVSIQINGGINGMLTRASNLSTALGNSVNLNVDTDILANQPINVRSIKLTANGLTLDMKGEIEKTVFNGNIGIKADTLEPLAMLSGKPLSGAADIEATGTIGLLSGAFDLGLSGNTSGVKTGNASVDRLLNGDIRLSGGIKRDQSGITTRNFFLGNDQIKLQANGYFSSVEADMDYQLDLADLGLLDPRMRGSIAVKGAVRGHNRLIAFSLGAKIPDAMLSGKKMDNTVIFANAVLDNTSPIETYISGSLLGDGIFAGQELKLAGDFVDNNRDKSIHGLNITVGGTKVTGDLTQSLNGIIEGNLNVDAPDLSTIAALALTEGQGSLKGDFVFAEEDGKQKADFDAHIEKLIFADNRVESLDMKVSLADPKGAFHVDGYVSAQDIRTAALVINNLKTTAKDTNGKTVFNLAAVIQNDTKAELTGVLNYTNLPDNERLAANINTLGVTKGTVRAKLLNPATIILSDNKIAVDSFALDVNGGTLSLAGYMGDKLDLQVAMNGLPVALANIVRADLGASGSLTGQATIKGTAANPDIRFDLKGEGLTTTILKEKNFTPLVLNAKGVTNSKILTIESKVSGGGLDVVGNGQIPLGNGNLDFDVEIKNLPVTLANSFINNQRLNGQIKGRAHIGGNIKNPTAQFNFIGQGLTADILAKNGLAPINLNVEANYQNSILNLEKLNANGPQGLNMSVSGRVPVLGQGIDLHVKGNAPLGIANQFLAERGAQATGTATIDTSLTGSFANPQLNGNFSLSNGSFIDSETNLRLNGIKVQGSLNGNRIVIDHVDATSSAGGTISANGSISTDFAVGMPADITVRLNHTRYSDGEMVIATVNGTVTVTGPLLRNPVIGGDLTIEKAEITVPDRLGGSALIDVKHKHLTKNVQTTLERAKIETHRKKNTQTANKPAVVQVKMRIRAPNQIFVRGMGLDVELGGEIGIFGPINDIHPVGGFQMLRGRFEILSQRLTFNEGRVTLVGNLNPEVNFVATTEGNDITVNVTVSGTIDALVVAFSSTPTLPQDEVLARLIFNRSISELSPFQIAQLASAAAQLAGVTNTSLLGALRSSTGLDDLDVITDKQGNTGVRAGRYIRDNIYLGVEAGSGGNTKGTVNLDITKDLKAKGALGAEGDSSVGVYYEKDY